MIVQVSRFNVWDPALRELRHEATTDLHYFWIYFKTFGSISYHCLDTLVEAGIREEVYLGVRLSFIEFYIWVYLLIWGWHFYFICVIYVLLDKSESLFFTVFLTLLDLFLLIFDNLIVNGILWNLPPLLLAGIVLALLLLIDVLLHCVERSDASPIILSWLFHRGRTSNIMVVSRLQVLHAKCLLWRGQSKLGGQRSLALIRIWVR